MHHDKHFAVERNGTRDIFLNTPSQAAWFERYITDWTGPHGRMGRVTFRMRDSVFPGDTMVFDGVVSDVALDDTGCGWVSLDITLSVDGDVKSTCTARVALPMDDDDNPWRRRQDRWKPGEGLGRCSTSNSVRSRKCCARRCARCVPPTAPCRW